MAKTRVERGLSTGLRERLAAARARRDEREEAESQAQVLPEAGGYKRKAAVLDEDGEGDENKVDEEEAGSDEHDEDMADAGEDEEKHEWDEAETAAALENSKRDIGRE